MQNFTSDIKDCAVPLRNRLGDALKWRESGLEATKQANLCF
jgi:hypothetical protein